MRTAISTFYLVFILSAFVSELVRPTDLILIRQLRSLRLDMNQHMFRSQRKRQHR